MYTHRCTLRNQNNNFELSTPIHTAPRLKGSHIGSFKKGPLALFQFKYLVFNPFPLFLVGWHSSKKVYTKKIKVINKRLQVQTRVWISIQHIFGSIDVTSFLVYSRISNS